MLRSWNLSFSGRLGMKLLRAILLSGVAGSLVVVGACSMSAQTEASFGPFEDRGEASPFGAGAGGGAGAGSVSDASIEIGAKDAGGRDPYERFAHLCGQGCRPGGDAAECVPEGNTGAGGSTDQPLACRLVPEDGVASAQCLPVGHFEAGGPCQTSADCAAGLGCEAAPPQGGVCRQYCCGSVESCASGTYCDARPMAESTGEGADSIAIPVCIPAMNCELLNERVCPAGLTCTIVRDDGTTSCVTPGVSLAREACPCASGFVCSMLTNECKKLCRVDNGSQECGIGGSCQGGSMAYPAGFGICVGGAW
jgi:hypothetical protein